MSSLPLLAGDAATTVARLPAVYPRLAHRISVSSAPALWKTLQAVIPACMDPV